MEVDKKTVLINIDNKFDESIQRIQFMVLVVIPLMKIP
jgi:hypothetical protein